MCVFCGYCKSEKQLEERYLRLEQTHPQLHDYCMNKLGFKEVCEYMGIKHSKDYDPEGQYTFFEDIDQA